MKKAALLFSALLLGLRGPVCAAQVVELTNGDRLTGDLLSISDGMLTFKMRGNVLKIPTTELKSIAFGDKASPASPAPNLPSQIKPLVLPSSVPAQAHAPRQQSREPGILKGLVTYYSNSALQYRSSYRGDIGDNGARIYIWPVGEKDPYADVYRFDYLKGCQSNQDKACLQKYGIKDDDGWNAYDQRVADLIGQMAKDPKVKRLVADNFGRYSQTLAPGFYGVLIKSHFRSNWTKTEFTGKISAHRLEVKSNQHTDFSILFW